MAFFNKFIDSISTDLQFVVDDISSEDTSAVGVTWHLGMQFLHYFFRACYLALSFNIK